MKIKWLFANILQGVNIKMTSISHHVLFCVNTENVAEADYVHVFSAELSSKICVSLCLCVRVCVFVGHIRA